MIFKEKLKNKSKIFLDGGNGSEIAKLGGAMSPAFAALATITSPDIVIKAVSYTHLTLPTNACV